MPHAIPPGPYCPPYDPKTLGGGSIIIGHVSETLVLRCCQDHGIPIDVRVPRLVWHLANTAACGGLKPDEKSRCWELARLVLAEASERMRADKLAGSE